METLVGSNFQPGGGQFPFVPSHPVVVVVLVDLNWWTHYIYSGVGDTAHTFTAAFRDRALWAFFSQFGCFAFYPCYYLPCSRLPLGSLWWHFSPPSLPGIPPTWEVTPVLPIACSDCIAHSPSHHRFTFTFPSLRFTFHLPLPLPHTGFGFCSDPLGLTLI